ncbi:MAG: TadE family protein [Candidatus Limnocylindrales bacterium]
MLWLRRRPRRERDAGQTLVEFAIVLPVFLLMVFGLIDVGRLVYTNATLSQAAREGARLAAAEARWIGSNHPACVADATGITAARPGAHVCPVDIAAFKSHVAEAVERMTVAVGPIASVYVSCNDGSVSDPVPSGRWTEASGGNGCDDGLGNPVSSQGELVSVRLEYTYDLFTPVVSSIIPSTLLSGSATMIIN